MAYVVIGKVSEELISLADMKLHLRVTYTLEDTLIQSYINEAIDYVETLTEKYLAIRTIQEYFPKYRLKGLELCKELVKTIDLIEYIAVDTTDSSYTSLDTSKYYKNLVSNPAKIILKNGEIFPELSNEPNPIRITYTSGYTSAAAPFIYVSAVKYLVAQKFQNRQNHVSRYKDIVTKILHSELDYSIYS